ncbi:MAG: ABC transporter permease [Lachnospiraceae bacterium]|nr:ABC transporter permease [Lachnospiraceae bacterium]
MVRMNKSEKIVNTVIKYKSAFILLLLCVCVSLLTPQFLSWTNIMNIARQTTTNGIIAIGMACVIIIGGIDLSVGSVLAFSTLITGLLITNGVPGFWAGILGVLFGGVIGIISGLLIAELDLPPFIVTLASMSIFRGFTMLVSGGMPVSLQNEISFFGAGYIGSVPFPVIILMVVFLIMWFVMNRTKFGRHIYAIGGNEQTASLSGINVKRDKILVYGISGLLAALSGIIIAARLNSAQPDAGNGYEMDAIAAAVIGGCSMSQGGIGTMGGVIIGSFIIGVLNNAMNLLNVSPFWQTSVKGFVILIAIIIDRMTTRVKKA